MADTMDLTKMKVSELKVELKNRGLPVSGSKTELIKRLAESMGASDVDGTDDAALEDKLDEILNDDPPVEAPAKPAQPAASVAAPPKASAPVAPSNGTKENNPSDTALTADSTKAGKVAEVVGLTAEQRLKMRAEKFGIVNPELKKQARAERFGLQEAGKTLGSAGNKNLSSEEVERLKKRADRFGVVTSTSLSKTDEEDRKRKRAERFGISSTTSASTGKAVISVNSTDPELEAKKKKRAERFGLAT